MKPENQARLTEYQQFIENYLDSQCFCYDGEPQQILFEAMRYSLLAGGKRLRPVFVLDFCRMCGGGKRLRPLPRPLRWFIHTA